MKKIFLPAVCIILLLCSVKVTAQCSFTPTITPNNPVLCPQEIDTLWTQVYDSYQWYKDGVAIPGAVQQYLPVSQATDVGSYFKVEATQSSCAELSDSILVDGWAFLLPYVVHGGTYSTDPLTGNIVLCPGVDTMTLEFSYPNSIQWFNNGVAIPGANSQILKVTAPGSYTAEGAPAVCPQSIYQLGVTIDVGYITAHITPDDLMLCPNAVDTLWTDPGTGYQWFKDNLPISGATNQYLPVEQYQDAGSMFSVAATILGCDVHSDTVLVDGWAFASLSVASSGNFTVGENGEMRICEGDTVFMAILPPYNINIQWYKDGNPVPGADSVGFAATEEGNYTVKGSPEQCPDFSQDNFGLPITVEVRPGPVQPVISVQQGILVATPVLAGAAYQWYKDGVAIPGADSSAYDPDDVTGSYTVKVTDGSGCSNISAAFSYNPTGIGGFDKLAQNIRIYPSPATDIVYVSSPVAVNATLCSIDGSIVLKADEVKFLNIGHLAEGMYILRLTDREHNFIKAQKIIKLK
jgi:hypothetical protein